MRLFNIVKIEGSELMHSIVTCTLLVLSIWVGLWVGENSTAFNGAITGVLTFILLVHIVIPMPMPMDEEEDDDGNYTSDSNVRFGDTNPGSWEARQVGRARAWPLRPPFLHTT